MHDVILEKQTRSNPPVKTGQIWIDEGNGELYMITSHKGDSIAVCLNDGCFWNYRKEDPVRGLRFVCEKATITVNPIDPS